MRNVYEIVPGVGAPPGDGGGAGRLGSAAPGGTEVRSFIMRSSVKRRSGFPMNEKTLLVAPC